jgi:hypothetical protein
VVAEGGVGLVVGGVQDAPLQDAVEGVELGLGLVVPARADLGQHVAGLGSGGVVHGATQALATDSEGAEMALSTTDLETFSTFFPGGGFETGLRPSSTTGATPVG